ncbi:site-specific integrase [Arthrobacter sp. SO3]|uniref:site-specific integrase n=1 Tax=Arthrobacter sp. SO3 TaxID=1897057 RepID=UPI001CFF9A6E|nr:phage integrase SAM-like domain-containing protein [Arthrobacter sp. SO3]MCB5292845.1 Tyrosine recombinase XerC [Arthrobacter sp. SO3]
MRAAQITFPVLVQDFFCRRLIDQRGASARTIESYRDAFELLFAFVIDRTRKHPEQLCLSDLDAQLVSQFLDYLETDRKNTVRTRNARLAAIHSFMRYAAVRDPASLATAEQVLAIPAKTIRQAGTGLPHPRTSRSDPRRTGSDQLERPPGRGHAGHPLQHRSESL